MRASVGGRARVRADRLHQPEQVRLQAHETGVLGYRLLVHVELAVDFELQAFADAHSVIKRARVHLTPLRARSELAKRWFGRVI